ncbi:uncharacterized protein LOC114716258 [Neltuma alba]|uniref:uncharacterized protein LOC114716258 n=1 Tax=Neltuma alba TaxID=207710 RepID=UPI0010A317F0|nr:uncharacterized protein LOC114716258 [Prosopis alba]XP_028757075.1 uncharacterized protein LOC114716258 [Prosopis alba]
MMISQYREDAPEETEALLSFEGIKKVKVNQVKDSDSVQAEARHNLIRQNISDRHQAYNGEPEIGYMSSIGQALDKGRNVTLMELPPTGRMPVSYHWLRPMIKVLPYRLVIPIIKRTLTISFCGFPDGQDIIPVNRPSGDFGPLYNLSSVQVSTAANEKELNASNSNATVSIPGVDKLKAEPVSKNKPELKAAKKEAPNSFPSNVRSLISTGMLDGVPVKYVSVSRVELGGIIKGSGYLCGCQSCNYSKVLNAYEFERHAGCKTKHPNNHIYFENGKTIYQIVQELRSTPESLLFDTIQTVFGSPINQKAFRNWKESFQAAARELQRIYGKEELNI